MRCRAGRFARSGKQAGIFIIGLILAFARSGFAGSGPPPDVPIILISVDTLRADHLSSYGYRRFATPNIDSLGRGGTIFEEINSQIPLTLPSHTSLLTSTYPFANGVDENGLQVPAGAVTLAGVLKAHGYHTAAFIGGYFLARRFGLDQGFDLYDSPFGGTRAALVKALDLKRPASDVTNRAEAWLAEHSQQSTFVFIHLFDLHRPYDPPAKLRARFHADEYDAELDYVDEILGQFWKFLSSQHLFERSLIVFTADHGESLGEHGESTHGYFVYESTLHVPLIIHWPRGAGPYPARVSAPAGLIDVAPTILQAVGLDTPASFQGESLFPFLAGSAPVPRKVYSESLYAHDNFRCAPLRSLREGNLQYIAAPRAELYDLSRDPGELHNLAGSEKDLGKSLGNELAALRAEYEARHEPARFSGSGGDRAALRALGYVSLSRPERLADESGPDPKDRLLEYREYLRAARLARIQRLAEAEATFRAVLETDPQNLPARFDLAECYLEQRRPYDAVAQLRDVLALEPQDVEAEDLLGAVWLAVRDYGRARAEFHDALEADPNNYKAEYNLGVIAALENRFDDGRRRLNAALALRPQSAEAYNALGAIDLQRGELAAAQEEFQQALRFDPQFADAHYNLGRVFRRQKRTSEAVQQFRQALREDPHFVVARKAIEQLGPAGK